MTTANDDFSAAVMAMTGEDAEFTPYVHYTEDGDCLEFFASNEEFKGERIDSLVTVYYGQNTGEIVGALIKGIRSKVNPMLAEHPGLAIEVKDGSLKLSILFAMRQLESGDRVAAYRYQKLRHLAEASGATLELCGT